MSLSPAKNARIRALFYADLRIFQIPGRFLGSSRARGFFMNIKSQFGLLGAEFEGRVKIRYGLQNLPSLQQYIFGN